MSPTLIFDCDGVLADTERDGHLPAFNQTFAEAGLPIHWSEEEYGHLLAIGGGKERLATVFTPLFAETAHLPTDPDEQRDLIARWHKAKTAHYTAMVADGVLPGRPGIERIVAEAADAGWGLAVASTSAEASVRAVLEHAVGADLAAPFTVFAGDVVPAKKPAPDIYLLALRELRVGPQDVVVVEDSANGLRAALGAGLRTIVTVSSYTADEDFTGASLVVSSLGDLPEHPATVLSNPHDLAIDGQVELSHVEHLLHTTP
ncbi:HAD-IA family hydrolase [Cellulomonas sp. Leaf395]|uniref:HAD-IA family hydrolase n=1 Tax=Cellulomonas sp. Leaf395 TaxID=1736362 RepID=UPI0006F4AA53|nr:HAD-IA family hydrolase [Cellulomonas sp. Leaf395]KQT01165.1 haloacid dehalogenase [Cellulomonas sp. Leaf395]